jgi:2,3-diaminopropionate biosynthesis protein SbnA
VTAHAGPTRTPDLELLARIERLRQLFTPTPVRHLALPFADVHAKLEYFNPIGSIKDRPAFAILEDGIRKGRIVSTTTVVESSSGNFACSLAVFCRLLGIRFVAVVDPRISRFYFDFLEMHCASVVKVTRHDDTGGFLKTRLETVAQICSNDPDTYWTNQYAHPAGVDAHYRGTGPELLQAAPELDYVFVSVSSAGTLAGVSKFFREARPSVRVVAVDAEGSVIFGGPAKKRFIPGLGSSIVPEQLGWARFDAQVVIPEHESVAACERLLSEFGLFLGGSSGACFAAIERYRPEFEELGYRPHVGFYCADRGTAYLDTIYNSAWADALRGEALRTNFPPAR